jgi:hypothetical protein
MTLVQLIVPCMMYPAYQRLQVNCSTRTTTAAKGFQKQNIRRQKGKRPSRGEMARRQQYHMVKMYGLRQTWRHTTMTLVQLIVPCMMYPAYQRLQHMVRQRQLFNN